VNGINKLAGEWYHLLYNNVYGIRACALRLTNTYGPGMRVKDARQTFLGIWIRNLIEGKPLLVFGDGLQLRDFNYVDDVVEAFLIAALDPKADGEVYNLGSSEYVNLKDLASMMVELFKGGTFQIVPFPPERKAIDIGDYYSDFAKIKDGLGWAPRVSLREGLKRSLEILFSARKTLLGARSMILMNDFKAEPEELVRKELVAVERVIRSGWYILGNEVKAFESDWAARCGAKHAIASETAWMPSRSDSGASDRQGR